MNRNLRGRRRWRDLTRGQKTALSAGAVVQFALAAAAWADLAQRAPEQVRGPKWRWAALVAVNYAGPITYFRWGRRRPAERADRGDGGDGQRHPSQPDARASASGASAPGAS